VIDPAAGRVVDQVLVPVRYSTVKPSGASMELTSMVAVPGSQTVSRNWPSAPDGEPWVALTDTRSPACSVPTVTPPLVSSMMGFGVVA
jgi:hypothetical protein